MFRPFSSNTLIFLTATICGLSFLNAFVTRAPVPAQTPAVGSKSAELPIIKTAGDERVTLIAVTRARRWETNPASFTDRYYEAAVGREIILIKFSREPVKEGLELKVIKLQLSDENKKDLDLLSYVKISINTNKPTMPSEIERGFEAPIGSRLGTLRIDEASFDLTGF